MTQSAHILIIGRMLQVGGLEIRSILLHLFFTNSELPIKTVLLGTLNIERQNRLPTKIINYI